MITAGTPGIGGTAWQASAMENTGPKRFFISYAHGLAKDENLASHLYYGLRSAGHTVFIDRDIPIGSDWSAWIDEQIAQCDFMVVLLSSQSIASPMVEEEVRRAHDRLRATGSPRLFPIRVDYQAPLPYAIGGYLHRYQGKNWRTATDSERLLKEIIAVAEGRLYSPGPAVFTAAEDNTWNAVLKRSRRQAERFLQEAKGTQKQSGLFIPQVYVHRKTMESKLAAFLDSDALGFILVGDSGVGKTNLLCQWTLDLLQSDYGVFFYNCGGSIGLDIDHEIAEDLAPDQSDPLLTSLQRIDGLAHQAGRRFVIILDAINEFRGGPETGPEALLKRIDALLGHLPDHNVRILISCSTATWNRLQRLDVTQLYWNRYYHSANHEPVMYLGLYTPQEFETAYTLYQSFFQLQTSLVDLSPALRQRLQHPLLLRMLADAYRGRDDLITDKALALSIYQRYYQERVRQRRDQFLIDELVAEMFHQQRAALPLNTLARNPNLGVEILSERPDSSYQRLLDSGILTEIPGDLVAGDNMVRFTYPTIGAYTLACHLQRELTIDKEILATLVDQANRFPLAWDTARTLLLLSEDFAIVADAANSPNNELRELVAESLTEKYADEPGSTESWLKELLSRDSEEARRTALKAAYYTARHSGPRARDIFLWAAETHSPALRQAVKNTLYLIWRNDPEFTYNLLHALLEQIKFSNLPKLPRILEFVIDLSVTIYINHCEQRDVIEQTNNLYYELATKRLHLNLFNTGMLGPAFERLVFRAFANAFSQPILNTMLFTELVPAERFFGLSIQERACLKHIAPLLDPLNNLRPAKNDLVAMLQSKIMFFSVVAALALAIHAYQDFSNTKSLLKGLFDELTPWGQLWELLSFSVLLPQTPFEWVDLLEEFTQSLIREHPETFYATLPIRFDIFFIPLGLAYGKREPAGSMPLFKDLIKESRQQADWRRVTRCIRALGPVGFYYPKAVFATLQESIPDCNDTPMQNALLQPLAIMRTLHFDAVDIFMHKVGLDEGFRRRVSAAADVELVQRYISWLGFYNNAVHFSLFYPKMRRALSMGALNLLAEARNPLDFTINYTATALHMFRDADFQLISWTLPE